MLHDTICTSTSLHTLLFFRLLQFCLRVLFHMLIYLYVTKDDIKNNKLCLFLQEAQTVSSWYFILFKSFSGFVLNKRKRGDRFWAYERKQNLWLWKGQSQKHFMHVNAWLRLFFCNLKANNWWWENLSYLSSILQFG